MTTMSDRTDITAGSMPTVMKVQDGRPDSFSTAAKAGRSPVAVRPSITRVDRAKSPCRAAPQTSLDLASLQLRLQELGERSSDLTQAISVALTEVRQMTVARWATYLSGDESADAIRATATGKLSAIGDVLENCIRDHAHSVMVSQQAEVMRRDNLSLIAVPVIRPGRPPDVIVLGLTLDGLPAEPFVTLLQVVATYVALWHEQRHTAELSWEAQASAAVAELVQGILASHDVESAIVRLANELNGFLATQQVCIGLVRSPRSQFARLLQRSRVSQRSTVRASTHNGTKPH